MLSNKIIITIKLNINRFLLMYAVFIFLKSKIEINIIKNNKKTMLVGILLSKEKLECGNKIELLKMTMKKNKLIKSNLDSAGLNLDECFTY
ncbi:MAG: hypothetical protein KBT75_13620 [Oleispira antarctica]|nr:hypothetical protein [Oleispira antarctica]MBQ0792978.1 hypothetical protein [Oleispira antarctica]